MIFALMQCPGTELSDVQAGFRLPAFAGSCRKQGNSRKTSTSALLTMLKPLTVWTTTNCGNSSRDGNTRPLDLPPEKPI